MLGDTSSTGVDKGTVDMSQIEVSHLVISFLVDTIDHRGMFYVRTMGAGATHAPDHVYTLREAT